MVNGVALGDSDENTLDTAAVVADAVLLEVVVGEAEFDEGRIVVSIVVDIDGAVVTAPAVAFVVVFLVVVVVVVLVALVRKIVVAGHIAPLRSHSHLPAGIALAFPT
jgi:hypothetical protein